MTITIHIYNGTGLQIPKTEIVENVETYQDIITNLINMGYKSGKLYNLDGNSIDNGNLIMTKELNYVMLESEPTNTITVVTNTDPQIQLSIPYSSDITYGDVYNYALAQSGYRLGFLRLNGQKVSLSEIITEFEGLTLELGVLVHISSNGELINSVYILDGSIYQDIITNIIQSGVRSGRIFTSKSIEIDYNSPIIEQELHYIIFMSEPSYNIPISIIGAPIYSIEIPASKDMTYLDVYNYTVSQVQPNRKIFLVINNGRINDLKPVITDTPIFAFYELP